MTIETFLKKWMYPRITIGIDSNHESFLGGRIEQLSGKNAWEKIYDYYPPNWDFAKLFRKPFREWFTPDNKAYSKIIEEEKANGTIKDYRDKGLSDYNFCIIADNSNNFGVLVDGAHRFIILNFLKRDGANIEGEIDKIILDVLYIDNFNVVIPYDSNN